MQRTPLSCMRITVHEGKGMGRCSSGSDQATGWRGSGPPNRAAVIEVHEHHYCTAAGTLIVRQQPACRVGVLAAIDLMSTRAHHCSLEGQQVQEFPRILPRQNVTLPASRLCRLCCSTIFLKWGSLGGVVRGVVPVVCTLVAGVAGRGGGLPPSALHTHSFDHLTLETEDPNGVITCRPGPADPAAARPLFVKVCSWVAGVATTAGCTPGMLAPPACCLLP